MSWVDSEIFKSGVARPFKRIGTGMFKNGKADSFIQDILVIRDLRKRYPAGIEAIQGISFTVKRGECFSLLGPNGAGKSSTARVLASLSRPTAGSVIIAGQNLETNAGAVRTLIGYVAQSSSLDLFATGRENLRFQTMLHHLPRKVAEQRTDFLLSFFGLKSKAAQPVRTYSGGLRRRLDIALGLVHRPRLLILDEPTTGLDPESRVEMWHELSRLMKQEDLAIFLTTHYLEEAEKLADRVAIMYEGKIIASGTPDELKNAAGNDGLIVEVRANESIAEACRIIEQLEGISIIAVEAYRIHLRAANGPSRVSSVVTALDAAQVPIVHITVARASLEEVYLQITARAPAISS